MVVAAAKEIANDDCVFVGMRLPLLAFQLAKETHAPDCTGIFETGLLRNSPAAESILTMGDLPNIHGAVWTTSMIDIMGILQSGRATLGFLGSAQVDRFGNINTTCIGSYESPKVRLPGSGGASDIASLSGRFVIVIAHEKNRLPDRVDFMTSPGYGAGNDWRERQGIKGGGPAAVITTRAVFRFDPITKEAILWSLHPGVTLDEALDHMGWEPLINDPLITTPAPTKTEIETIRKFDPDGFWTR